MSISYQSKDSALQNVQLKVQELCVTLTDISVISASASTVTIDFHEPVLEFRSAIHQQANGTISGVPYASPLTSGNITTFTLAAPMATGDSLTLKYVINESV